MCAANCAQSQSCVATEALLKCRRLDAKYCYCQCKLLALHRKTSAALLPLSLSLLLSPQEDYVLPRKRVVRINQEYSSGRRIS